MPISFSCPKCGHVLAAPERLAGHKAKCRCGAVVVVPEIEPQELGLAEAPEGPAAPIETAPFRDPGAVPDPRAETYGAAPPDPGEPAESRSAVQNTLSGLADAFDGIRSNLARAVRLMAVAVAVTAPLPIGGMFLLRSVMEGGGSPMESAVLSGVAIVAPTIVAGMLGACFGFVSGRMMTDRTGLYGWPACAVGSAGVFLLMGLCLGAALLLFSGPIPSMVKCGVFSLGFMAMIGISFYTLWVD